MNESPADATDIADPPDTRVLAAEESDTHPDPDAGPPDHFDLLPDDIREVLLANPPPPLLGRRQVQEQERLMADTHPGVYVAYRDVWNGRTFVRREVLAHAADLRGVHEPLMAQYSDLELDAIRVTYCEPLERRSTFVVRNRG